MTALAGKLWFQDGAPLTIFADLFGLNVTTGGIYDWMVDGQVSGTIVPGQPAPIIYPAPPQQLTYNRTYNKGRIDQEFGFVIDKWKNAAAGMLPPPPSGLGTPQPPAPVCPSGSISTQ